MDKQKLQNAIIDILAKLPEGNYMPVWSIADRLGIDRSEFGGAGIDGPGNDALNELIEDGKIYELSDLNYRYRMTVKARLEYRIAALEAAEASHHQALATVEAMLAECQQQAAVLARDAGLTAADMILLRETVQALRAIGRRPKLAGQVDALLGRLEVRASDASR